MTSSTVLIVDDDPTVVASLALLLDRRGYRTLTAEGPESALRVLETLERPGREEPALVLQDMNFSRETTGREGLELLQEIRRRHPELPVILITAWGSIDLAVEGMKAGAADFVTKPWSNDHLLRAVETALSLAASRPLSTAGADEGAAAAPVPTRAELDRRFDFSGLVGEDPELLRILELIGRVAPTDASVLVEGESGTGKELVAEAIHRNSRRREGPFVKVNLGGISSTLFESEMFGHVRGAFTDARSDRTGRFEQADGGTIFLDEIGETDPAAQVKLLRVLQDRTYEVLGSSVTRKVDVRVIAATNRDLPEAVAAGDFREDLLYRLNLITIRVPALRDRPGDIPRLARHFLDRAARTYRRGASEPVELSGGAAGWLRAQRWPGNVRQLRQTMERAVLVSDAARLEAAELRALTELTTRHAGDRALPSPGSMTLDEMERAMIERCLAHFDGNITRAAEALGLSRPALYRRMEKYGMG
ncbi:MAG: sigma-54 dependent transcriptional regulator [Acidobacteriota bacterium]|jgi:DNA-binding NtrC family response regulator